jgi:uncharacterized surface protein with fasciclin (FAS1) repeats
MVRLPIMRDRCRRAFVIVGLMLLAGCTAPGADAASPAQPQQQGQPGQQPPPPAPNPMIGGVPMFPSRNIVENLAQSPVHHTLSAALAVAGLADGLKQPGPFTVFAPTDDAFRDLPPGLLDQLMQPANQARLVALLNYHVLSGRTDSATLGHQLAEGTGSLELGTVAGPKVTARLNGAVNLLLRDATGAFADISIYDVGSANGVIHVIDKVLLPAKVP